MLKSTAYSIKPVKTTLIKPQETFGTERFVPYFGAFVENDDFDVDMKTGSSTYLIPADPRAVEPGGQELAVHGVLQFDLFPDRLATSAAVVVVCPCPRLSLLREQLGGPRVSLDLADGLDEGPLVVPRRQGHDEHEGDGGDGGGDQEHVPLAALSAGRGRNQT